MNSDDASPTKIRERTDDDAEPVPKRLRSDAGPEENSALTTEVGRYSTENLLPPSHVLLPPPPPGTSVVDGPHIPREIDVGITEYVSKDAPKIEGIIKQRWRVPGV